jgi:succinylglutamate desuccinylase
MKELIEQALSRFESIGDQWTNGFGSMVKHSSYVYLWTPPQKSLKSVKKIGLTLQAITHGNEVGGITSLTECMKLIRAGVVKPDITMAFVLGNPAAALENRRFLESDLNRSFGSKSASLEGQRAAHLESILNQTDYLLDFHQTIEESSQAFFIFPYTAPGLAFARAAHADVSVVTHWGKPFSLDGMCTDEFVNFNGGTGITIELGKKGFDPYQCSVGLQAALGAIHYVQDMLSHQYQPATTESPLYTWKAIVLYEEGMDLSEGLYNFQPIEKGQVIGVHGDKPLLAAESGSLLFPKFHRDQRAPRPREIYRIAKRIGLSDLGQPGVVGV